MSTASERIRAARFEGYGKPKAIESKPVDQASLAAAQARIEAASVKKDYRFLTMGRTRSQIASALVEYRTFARLNPDHELAPILLDTAHKMRLGLKEQRKWQDRSDVRRGRLVEAWAGRYVNESDAEPTDVEMARVFAPCCCNCDSVLYPAIRAAIYRWRVENGKASRLGEL